MNISGSSGSHIVSRTYANNGVSNAKTVSTQQNSTTKAYVEPLRDRMLNMINRFATDEKSAENLLKQFSKPNMGGPLIPGDALPDLKDPDAVRRFQRISHLFTEEQKNVESQKNKLISKERNEGKSAKEILSDLISFHDSQSELYRLGTGWNGDLFGLTSSSEGWERTLRYTPDVFDMLA